MRQTLIREFEHHVSQEFGLEFADFEALHRWSVENLANFWETVWRFEGLMSPTPYAAVLGELVMPGARWFDGAQVNYAQQIFRHVDAAEADGQPAIVTEDELGNIVEIGWHDLRRRSFSLACELERLGIRSGDRIAAYLPNRAEAVIAFLACASLGAIWTVCAPDMGIPAILDRFRQVEPRVIFASDGVRYAGKTIDLAEKVRTICSGLPTLEYVVRIRSGYSAADSGGALEFEELCGRDDARVAAFVPRWLPFDHPLWILYSSGTTGKPKAIVHGHGGILLNSAAMRLHWDIRPSYDPGSRGERLHWLSSTGWMVWNAQVGGLLSGTTICLYDGSPSGARDDPDWTVLWRFAARHKVSFFGAGAQYFTMCAREGVDFATLGDLSNLRTIGSTASPLPAEVQTVLSDRLAEAGYDTPWWLNSSGGTDICGAFCSGNRDAPPAPGKIQCRQLGAAVEAWSPDGVSVVGEVGELVCTKPMPSMPLYFWGDPDGSRYRDSYFGYFTGVWRHGDWIRINADGSCEIFGRSDATVNRGGHRMGTSEIYDAIERVAGVGDSLVVDIPIGEGESELLAFIVPDPSALGEMDIARVVASAIRTSLSPRFVPDRFYSVAAIPRTLSMKKQELPVKRLFEGRAIVDVIDPATMANPECLPEFAALAEAFRSGRAARETLWKQPGPA